MLWQPTNTTKRVNALRGSVAPASSRFAEQRKAILGARWRP